MKTEKITSPIHILIVDDNADTVYWMAKDLEEEGYIVTAAKTMKEALEKFSPSGANVLISDIGLPDGTGLELLRQLESPGPELAIAMSGYGMKEDIEASRKAGFNHHLVKPFEFTELQKILQEKFAP